jgi:2-C-methyl-D-erythritol 4-phosphate cytidylyltransferase
MPDATDVPVVWVVVVAAGSGSRFGGAKQFAPLAGRRVLDWSVAAARSVADGVVLVLPAGAVGDGAGEPAVDVVVAGAETRSGSVRAGLAAVPADADVVLVHDAARPVASHGLFRSVVDAVIAGADAVVPVVGVVDTITDPHGVPVDRDHLRAVQTPQGFQAEILRRVHATAPEATDDASLVAASGGRLRPVQGERWNLKITEADDLVVAEALLEQR